MGLPSVKIILNKTECYGSTTKTSKKTQDSNVHMPHIQNLLTTEKL